MNYLQRNKPNRSGVPKYVWVIVVFVFLSGLTFLFPKAARTTATALARPFWIMHDNTISGINSFGNYFVSKNTLIKENSTLHDQVVALQLKSSDYDTTTAENQSLKEMLGRQEGNTSSTTPTTDSKIIARVLSKPPQSPYDTLVIDAGSADGITLGKKVFLSNTVVVGIVTDVTPHTSLVTLFSESGQKNTTEDLRTGASFEMDGQGGANMTITVPKDTDIVWGDTFVYPALSSEIMATVYYIDIPSGSSFKTAHLRISQSIFSAQWVFMEKM